MTETTVYCDRCKAKIDADRTSLENRCGPFVDARRSFDLCRSCFESLQSWIDTRPGVHASDSQLLVTT